MQLPDSFVVSAMQYTGGHDVLGRLIEVWTGMEYSAFLQQEIFKPLKMCDTGFAVPKAKRHRLVQLCSHEEVEDSAGRLYTQVWNMCTRCACL